MRFYGFHLAGLRDPYVSSGANAKKPLLWTNAGISVSQLPAEFADYTIHPVLPPGKDVGENWVGDPRGGLPSGGDQAIDIPEDIPGELGKILLCDPNAPWWFIKSAVIAAEDAGPITIEVYGRPGVTHAPQVDTVYWIEEEAFYCADVEQLSLTSPGITFNVTLERAACGSYIERHEIDPASYGGGDGSDVRLRLESKPNWEAHRFKAMLVCWRLPKGRSTTAQELDRRYFYVDDPPELMQEGLNYFYRIKPRAISDVVREHRFYFGPESIDSKFRLQVLEIAQEVKGSTVKIRPLRARGFPSRLGAERLFRHILHLTHLAVANLDLVNDLADRINACLPEVETRVRVIASGGWTFRVTDVGIPQNNDPGTGKNLVTIELELVAWDDDAAIATGSVQEILAGASGDILSALENFTPSNFSAGWSWNAADPLLPGEVAPTFSLRYAFHTTPIKAAQIILHSRCGASGGPYDKMIGFQLSLPDAWINDGIAAALGAELDIDPRTKELIQLDQLLNETITPQFHGEDTAGQLFQDLCLFYLLMFVQLSTGKVTLRRWATSAPESLSEIVPLKSSLDTAEPLDPLRALRLFSGINESDLSPQFARTATLGGIKTVESLNQSAQSVRLWQPGNVIDNNAVTSEAFNVFFRALFTVLGGKPKRYLVASSLEVQNFEVGDALLWSDPKIPTPEGRGFSLQRYLVVRRDANYRQAEVNYGLLRDYFNENDMTESVVAPALEIVSVTRRVLATYSLVTVQVRSIGETNWDFSEDLEIWTTLHADSAWVRVYHARHHNPVGETEREGYLECSAMITGDLFSDAAARRYELTLRVHESWDRGGFTAPYDILRRGARLVLSDYRPDDTNPEGILIEPHPEQLSMDGTGKDFAKWGAVQTFDRSYTLLSDVP